MTKAILTLAALAFSFAAEAQVTILAQQARGAGTYYTASVMVTQGVANHNKLVSIVGTVQPSDLRNQSNTCTLAIEWFDAANGIWREYASNTWEGGGQDRFGTYQPPAIRIGLGDNFVGIQLRARLDLPQTMTLGLTAQQTDM